MATKKEWGEAIRRLAMQTEPTDSEGRRRLELLALSLYEKAMKGDISALKEIGDRLDGKAVQPHEGTDDGPPIQLIKRVILDSTDNTDGADIPPLT